MRMRSLVVSSLALGAVVLIAVGGLALADGQGVWVMRGHSDHDTDASAGWLGVRIEEAVDHDEGGALVRSVIADSPADESGVRAGDIIVAVDGRTVRGPGSLTERIRNLAGGDDVTLTIVRDGREITIDAELGDIGTMVEDRIRVKLDDLHIDLEDLGERLEALGNIRIEGLEGLEGLQGLHGLEHLEHLEELGDLDLNFDFDFDFEHLEELGEHMGRVFVHRCENGDCENLTFSSDRPRLGVGLSETTPELRRHLGGDDDSGALVDRVVSGSPAEDAGMRVGDLIVAIDGTPVKSATEIRRALDGRDGDRLRVDVIRDGSPRTLDVAMPARERDDDDRRSRGPRA